MRVRPVVVAVAVAAWSSGCFELQRLDGLRDGDIRVEVKDDAGDPVVGAAVFAVGTSRVGISNTDGIATVGPMPFGDYAIRVEVVGDDGVVDAGGYGAAVSTIDALSTSSIARLTSFDQGPIVVATTGSVSGTVTGCAATSLCRVVAFRTVAGVTLPAEGTGIVDNDDGSFTIAGLVPGDVQLAAFAWERPLSTEPLQQLIAATRPTHFGTGRATVGDSGVALDVDSVAPASASAGIAVRDPELADSDRAQVTGTANYLVPTTTTFATVAGVGGTVPGDEVDIPVGVFDLTVQLDGRGGRLDGLVGVPGLDAPYVPVTIGGFDCVVDGAVVDCNGDGSSDYASAADVDLDNDGEVDSSDPDVDGDGIADANEPTACRVAGRGGDRDADCLCDAVDPLPDCQSNDPVACAAAIAPTCE